MKRRGVGGGPASVWPGPYRAQPLLGEYHGAGPPWENSAPHSGVHFYRLLKDLGGQQGGTGGGKAGSFVHPGSPSSLRILIHLLPSVNWGGRNMSLE